MMFPRKLHVWVTHAVMSGERIGSAERLLLRAKVASDLLLAGIVYRVSWPGHTLANIDPKNTNRPGCQDLQESW